MPLQPHLCQLPVLSNYDCKELVLVSLHLTSKPSACRSGGLLTALSRVPPWAWQTQAQWTLRTSWPQPCTSLAGRARSTPWHTILSISGCFAFDHCQAVLRSTKVASPVPLTFIMQMLICSHFCNYDSKPPCAAGGIMHEVSGTMKPMSLCATIAARQLAGRASRLTPHLMTLSRLLVPLPGRAVRPGPMCSGRTSLHSSSPHPSPNLQLS